MNPSSIGGAGLGATAGGAALSAFGSIGSGIANRQMFDYQAGIARLNQQIDLQNAQFATQTGEQQSLQFGLKAGQQMGQIKVAQASSGFDVNSGSAKAVQSSQRGLNLLDTDIIRSNAAKTAYGYTEQATVAGAQANLYTAAGSNAMTAGILGAGSSVLGGVGSVSSMWLQGQRVGLWGGSSGDDNIGAV
jgi:hypothetical protein